MTEIEEIPIGAEDNAQNNQDDPQSTQEEQIISEDIPKKGRGRPAGAKNKPKPKPAPKPKTNAKAKQKQPDENEEHEESEEEEAPPPRRRARQEQPAELDRHALASDVLSILQQQRYQRTTAKRNHYASWFENMS